MGVLRILAADTMLNPLDDRLYSNSVGGSTSLAGVSVSPDAALSISAVWRACDLLASTMAKMPLIVYRSTNDGGKERFPAHPLYWLLHDQPNNRQTSFEWREMMMGHALLRGHAYSEILPGPRGAVDQLVPLHPDRISPKDGEMDPATGRLRYWYTMPNGTKRAILQEDMFHLRGAMGGVSIIQAARESIGMGIALARYGAATFGNGARPSGVVKSDKVIAGPGREKLRQEINQMHGGPDNAGRWMLLDEGMTWQQIGMTVADAEFVNTMQWTIADWARWFGLPPHKLMQLERSTNNNIEHQGIEFVVDAVLPWALRWEQTIQRDLIQVPVFFAEFLLQGLMRGDTAARYAAYAIGRQWGFLSVNDIRRLEGMNPIPGGDVYLSPLNMVPAGTSAPAIGPGPTDDSGQVDEALAPALIPSANDFARDAAARVIRKEIAAMNKLAARTADDPAAFEAGVRDFYRDHGSFVSQVLHISTADASQYARDQRDALLTEGIAALRAWETEQIPHLADLALHQEVLA